MQDRIYLLSLREAFQEETAGDMLERAYEKLDGERRRRAQQGKSHRKRIESAGAGLLLQLAVRKIHEQSGDYPEEDKKPAVSHLTFAQLLEEIPKPLALEYIYKENGKPYFKKLPFFFSLSHSGEYALCAVSEEEVGADIQEYRACEEERLAERFFSEEEKCFLRQRASGEERQRLFYELWCRKEAYGKLTGEGIGAAVGKDMRERTDRSLRVFDIPAPDNYSIAVCKWCNEAEG